VSRHASGTGTGRDRAPQPGPGLRWVPLSVMRQIAVELQGNGSFDLFTLGMITTDEIRQYVSKEPMK